MTATVQQASERNAVVAYLDARLAAGRGDAIALRTPRAAVSYAELHALACRVGDALRDAGVAPEQRVALLMHDSVAFAAGFFGAIRIGAVAVPLNTRLAPGDIAAILSDSRARALIADASLIEPLRPLLDALPQLRHCIVSGPAGDLSDATPALPPVRPVAAAEPVCGDDMAFWLYTSGTTGTPKAAVHLHRDMLAWKPYGRDVLGVTADDCAFATSRLFFAYALGNALLIPLAAGGSTYVQPEWPDPSAVARVMSTVRPTLFFSVPTMYARMLREELPADSFRSARFGVSAGERLPAEVHDAYRTRHGLEIVDGMGATETIFMILSNRPGQSRAGSSGQPVPGTEVRLLDAGGNEVPVGEQGVLHARAPTATPFYWNRVDHSRRVFVGEWFRTGDVYTRDAEGFYYHCGREDDLFKVAGQWVVPAQVETVLLSHPAVAEAGVVGVEEGGGLVKAFAFVVPRDGAPPAEAFADELRLHAEAALPPHQRPRAIRVVSELPRTATGKLQRFRLKEQAQRFA